MRKAILFALYCLASQFWATPSRGDLPDGDFLSIQKLYQMMKEMEDCLSPLNVSGPNQFYYGQRIGPLWNFEKAKYVLSGHLIHPFKAWNKTEFAWNLFLIRSTIHSIRYPEGEIQVKNPIFRPKGSKKEIKPDQPEKEPNFPGDKNNCGNRVTDWLENPDWKYVEFVVQNHNPSKYPQPTHVHPQETNPLPERLLVNGGREGFPPPQVQPGIKVIQIPGTKNEMRTFLWVGISLFTIHISQEVKRMGNLFAGEGDAIEVHLSQQEMDRILLQMSMAAFLGLIPVLILADNGAPPPTHRNCKKEKVAQYVCTLDNGRKYRFRFTGLTASTL